MSDNKKSAIGSIMDNPKQRTMFLAFSAIGIVILIMGFIGVTRSNSNNAVSTANVSAAGAGNVQNMPGNSTNPAYNQAQQSQNASNANRAIEQGKSFEPTLVNNTSTAGASPIDSIAQKEAERLAKEKQDREDAERARLALLEEERAAQERMRQEKAMAELLEKQKAMNTPKTVQIEQVSSTPTKQPNYTQDQLALAILLNSYSYRNKKSAIETDKTGSAQGNQTSISAQSPSVAGVATTSGSNGNSPSAASSSVTLLKAGDMLNALLETSINTDEPSPVIVKVVGGILNGAKLMCEPSRNGEKALVKCTKLNIPKYPNSFNVNFVAVDPNTTRTGLASAVNNHYFERYVIGLGAAFLKGYSEAIGRQNSQTTITASGNVVVSQGQLTSAEIVKQGIGEVGKTVAEDTKQKTSNLQPTVTVNSGSAIGLVALDDVVVK